MNDTIAAIATPPGPGERGVIRISGPRAAELVRACWAGPGEAPVRERGLAFGRFDDGRGTQPAMLLWMPGPRSLTREDVAELHLPGAPPLLHAALERLLTLGARAARPGEFTRRAFEHGRIDLARAEGVLALIHADSAAERRSASALLLGGLSERVDALRAGLEALRALCEASLDFDESDTGHVPTGELTSRARELAARLEEATRWEERRAPAAGAPRLVLAGAPNAGKSSLYNALVSGGRALVSEHAGTTRDGAAGDLALEGGTARLFDAPGIEAAPRGADAVAQQLAAQWRGAADLVLWVAAATRPNDAALLAERQALPSEAEVLLCWSQVDRPDAAAAPPQALLEGAGAPRAWVAVSSATGAGLDALRAASAEALGLGAAGSSAAGAGLGRELSARHRAALRRARAELAEALGGLQASAPLDLVAEGLRAATDALDEISGRTTPEDLLDQVFARFCIGK